MAKIEQLEKIPVEVDVEDLNMDLPSGVFRTGVNPEQTMITMPRRPAIGFTNSNATFTTIRDDVDGELALFEGDIILGTTQAARNVIASDRGLGTTDQKFRWPGGIVPYVVVDSLRTRVEAAIAHWQTLTPFRFTPRTNEDDYVSFERRDGCWSQVGRQGGMQVISLGLGCGLGPAIHEIGHTLGSWHEQSRSDRDDFIEIIWANIDPQQRYNFDTHVQDATDIGNYDFGSIMHYSTNAFSINGQPTIRTKGGQPIGQRNGLSAGDIATVKAMYPDLNWA